VNLTGQRLSILKIGKMLEARLSQTLLLKKIVDALKEIIAQGTLDCSENGLEVKRITLHLSFCFEFP